MTTREKQALRRQVKRCQRGWKREAFFVASCVRMALKEGLTFVTRTFRQGKERFEEYLPDSMERVMFQSGLGDIQHEVTVSVRTQQ